MLIFYLLIQPLLSNELMFHRIIIIQISYSWVSPESIISYKWSSEHFSVNITLHLATLNLISCFIAHLLSLIISFGRPLFSLAWIPQCHLETVLPHCSPSFTDCLLIGKAMCILTQIPGENSKSSPCSLPWLHELKVCKILSLEIYHSWMPSSD